TTNQQTITNRRLGKIFENVSNFDAPRAQIDHQKRILIMFLTSLQKRPSADGSQAFEEHRFRNGLTHSATQQSHVDKTLVDSHSLILGFGTSAGTR
ncbi:MAG: hypothetical protein SFV81_21050, partial [Pirellulaceae bacterium]|nr:hypothetical protein [Pirellulaceae bacterium]